MRKFLILVLCCLMFVSTAYADNSATDVRSTAAVSGDGSCQVSISMTLHLDEPVSNLTLPLGTDISAVSLNGSSAKLQTNGSVTSVELDSYTKNVTGVVPITVSFTVNSCVTTDEDGRQIVTVPLLYGFTYPVETMNFSVTLPTEFDAVPTFLSGYHEQDIESDIAAEVSGNSVTGTVNTALKDHETLVMTLEAPEEMFPQVQSTGGTLLFDGIAMGVCGVLALVYWTMTMASVPYLPSLRSTAPEGVTAGNLGCYLVRKGADLTMMVVSWAQLGYLIIHLDDNGRVILHKRMEMGNERGQFERQTFRALFGKGHMIDATSYRYARICEKTIRSSNRHRWGYQKGSGNPTILRLLGCGIGLFAGIAVGDSLASSQAWRVILMILMSCGSAFSSWHIQEGMRNLQLNGRKALIVSGVCAAVFLVMGLASNCLNYTVAAVAANAVIGLLAAYTGHRTENGKRTRDEILGLRRYMCRVTKQELIRILRSNPDYYYELAPYALALGVDKRFAQRFGNMRMPGCTWLVSNMGSQYTATEWCALLRDAVDAMNNLQKRPPWEKFLNIR